jgi:glycolate oxidase
MGQSERSASLAELRSEISGSLVDEPNSLEPWSGDASHLKDEPIGAVRPEGVEDVVRLVRWARKWKAPLVPRGAGTSLDGESVPVSGALVVDLSGWTAPLVIDPVEGRARVGPGVTNWDLQVAAGVHRWFFPPNPGSWTTSTLGGNVSTNASGPRSYRYGPTRQWTVGGTIVLGTGEVVSFGTGARKRSAGPDPVGYLVGSEGTLGIFTELLVRLARTPEVRPALVIPVDDDRMAVRLTRAIGELQSLQVSAVEYLDRRSAESLAPLSGGRLPSDRPLILVEVESSADGQGPALSRFFELLREVGVREDATVYPDADRLWTLRGRGGAVLDREFGPRVREDLAAPVSCLPELFELVHRVGAEHAVPVWVYGHIGDGHLHPNYGVDPGSPVAARIRQELWEGVAKLNGTISGEHGIGILKRRAIATEHAPSVFGWMRAVKQACDPDGVMNPGKLYPGPEVRGTVASSPSPVGSGAGSVPLG